MVFQKRGTEVGTLLEQLARMVTVADRPMQPTVLWDSKCDVPLEHCLKELPAVGMEAAEVAGAEATETADAKVDAPSVDGSPAGEDGSLAEACEITLLLNSVSVIVVCLCELA